MDLRGTPGLGRALMLPVGSFAAAALGACLQWTVFASDRWLQAAVLTVGIFGSYELIRVQRLVLRQRAAADDWLRSATGGFVPARYLWRAEQLCAPRQRLTLARTLRLVEDTACERPVGMRFPLRLCAVQTHWRAVESLVRALEHVADPVTPAGMLRVIDLVTSAGGPLWGTSDAELGDALAATLAILTPRGAESTRAARAA